MKPWCNEIVLGIVLASVVGGQPRSEIDKLLAKVAAGPIGQAELYAIEGEPPDPRTLPALRKAFADRSDKQEKQRIALTLLRLGDKSEVYFDFLAGYAKTAVDDKAPMFLKYTSQGQPVRGEFDLGFLDWCKANSRDPREEASLQFQVYPEDMMILAEAEDPRARRSFARGLSRPTGL